MMTVGTFTVLHALTPYHVGALMYFFFLTIAYEGALANVNAFDQPPAWRTTRRYCMRI